MSLEYHFNKTFLKELLKIPEKQRIKIEDFVFTEIKNYKTKEEIPNLGKLKGHKYYYKLRFGDYRAGIKITNNVFVFERILHRKDIYKYFP